MEKPIEAEFKMLSTFSRSLGSLPSIGYPGSVTITSYLISSFIFMHQLCFRAVYCSMLVLCILIVASVIELQSTSGMFHPLGSDNGRTFSYLNFLFPPRIKAESSPGLCGFAWPYENLTTAAQSQIHAPPRGCRNSTQLRPKVQNFKKLAASA
jgi:hypothetical protein